MKLLNRLFGAPEEINGGERCPTYLFRWVVFSRPWLKIYLHHFVGDDWSRDMHDHPKRFISVGLRGWYIEHTPDAPPRVWRAPWIRSFPAAHIHRLTVPSKDCWTLVIVGRPEREWGFWHNYVSYVMRRVGIEPTTYRLKACSGETESLTRHGVPLRKSALGGFEGLQTRPGNRNRTAIALALLATLTGCCPATAEPFAQHLAYCRALFAAATAARDTALVLAREDSLRINTFLGPAYLCASTLAVAR